LHIDIDNLSKQYENGVFGVKNINMTIENGVTGLIGRNGAGKTTLIRLLATILEPTEGTILADKNSLDNIYRRKLGYLPQYTKLQPTLNAEEFLTYISDLKGINKKVRKDEISRCLNIVGLEEKKRQKLSTLSGGMLRRIGIAQALLGDPEVLLIDEPTSGLDPEERLYFHNLLSRIGINKVVLLSTHIISDIENLCDMIFILDEGRQVYSGNASELINKIDGMVWECESELDEENEMRRWYTVVSAIYSHNKVRVRYVTDNNRHLLASKKSPTLEDAYIYMLGGLKR
jgi:ABC-2 type transport system ATP-binding protein